MPSKQVYRVEYSKQEWKCEGKKCMGNGMGRKICIGELIWVRNETAKRHWGCISGKNRKTMKLHVTGSDHLNGFNDLQLKDMIRIDKDMDWGSVANRSNMAIVSPGDLIPTNQSGQSVPESESEAFDVHPVRSRIAISVQDVVGPTGSFDADSQIDPPEISSTSRMPHFEPIITFPQGPLPPLDFRFRTRTPAPSRTTTIPNSNNISAYKENPTSIIGKKLRFNDGNRTWEASEIVFSKKGWGAVTVEGEGESHKLDFEVLMSMLNHGVLDEVSN